MTPTVPATDSELAPGSRRGSPTADREPATSPVRRFTGLAPTGRLQLGNFLGAIRPMLAAQSAAEDDTNLVAIVDLHALTVAHRPHEVRAHTLEQATTLLAAGVDPTRTTIYVQSQLPEHTELHYLLECVASHGEVHRMTQFRERAEAAGTGHARLSLLTYPVLMAADILLHDTDEVPVGDDQSQHLELARDLVRRFNNRYGETFTVPRAVTPRVAGRIMDLSEPGAKMGKSRRSGQGVIYLLDPPDVLRQKIVRAVTDPGSQVQHDPVSQPGVANLLEIIAACTDADPAEVAAGISSYRQLKAAAVEAVVDVLAPIQRRYLTLSKDPHQVREVLTAGRDRARGRATATVVRTRRALGLL